MQTKDEALSKAAENIEGTNICEILESELNDIKYLFANIAKKVAKHFVNSLPVPKSQCPDGTPKV